MNTWLRMTVPLLLLLLAAGTLRGQERYEYDPAGRLTRVTYSDRSSIGYTYDKNGNVLSVSSGPASVDAVTGDANVLHVRVSPNPGDGDVRIDIAMSSVIATELTIADVQGRVVRRYRLQPRSGAQSLMWDGRDEAGVDLPAGTYFCRLRGRSASSGEVRAVEKIVLVGHDN